MALMPKNVYIERCFYVVNFFATFIFKRFFGLSFLMIVLTVYVPFSEITDFYDCCFDDL